MSLSSQNSQCLPYHFSNVRQHYLTASGRLRLPRMAAQSVRKCWAALCRTGRLPFIPVERLQQRESIALFGAG
jgi:hypothetical protein